MSSGRHFSIVLKILPVLQFITVELCEFSLIPPSVINRSIYESLSDQGEKKGKEPAKKFDERRVITSKLKYFPVFFA